MIGTIDIIYIMDIYQLRYFLAVVETRNFSRAAERVFVSQPTLSAGIKKLETDLGVVLINRGTRNITLTDAGLRFLPRARTVIYECNAAKQEASVKTSSHRLKIGIHRIIPIPHLAALLADFKTAHPDVQIALKEGSVEQLQSWLADGRIDLAISVPPIESEKIQFERLLKTKWVLAVSKSHSFAGRSSIPLKQLDRLDFIHRSHCITETETTRTFAKESVNPHIVFRTDEDAKALDLVSAGIGFCMLPDILSAPGITHIPVDGVSIHRTFGLLWHQDQENKLVDAFRLFATSHKWKPPRSATANLEWAR
ncbi:MAG: LysR family transcriptional regulator [Sneathiella sp.]|nr:LysR family transcriptional regulator [Sneathiella sp.]